MAPRMDYSVLAYYILVPVKDPLVEVQKHKDFFNNRDFSGRIYISEQGINGQSCGRIQDAKEYMDWLKNDPRFSEVEFKITLANEHAFPKMVVKYRRQLVALDREVDLSLRGEKLKASEWKQKLEERQEGSLLLDVRNQYEWEVGHFDGAETPALETFRQFPAYAKQLAQKHDPKTTPVMMYCTGGIRCEFYSALLKEEGFEKVYQLDGGVIQYGLEQGAEHWKGKLFVFDDRLVVPLNEQQETPSIGQCHLCQIPNETYYNCANMDCNRLFLCCLDCLKTQKGCCSPQCLEQGRVRPYHENAKPFRKFRSVCEGS